MVTVQSTQTSWLSIDIIIYKQSEVKEPLKERSSPLKERSSPQPAL